MHTTRELATRDPLLSTLALLVDSSLESSRSSRFLWPLVFLRLRGPRLGHALAMPFGHPHQAQQGPLPDWIASICIRRAGARQGEGEGEDRQGGVGQGGAGAQEPIVGMR